MRPSTLRLLTGLLALGAALAAAPARADSACLDDARRHCPDVPFGDGRVLACLERHWNQLSGACIQDIQKVQARSREISLACAADVWSFCPNVPPGEGRVRACLWERWDELSSTCKEASARLAEKANAVWEACQADAGRLCAGMRYGGGQVFLCLKAQESKVSGPCQRALR
jgi:hypothetical protein